jgi:ABC-2 type transport system permease protein
LLWEVGKRSFRRASTYRVATASGAFVNTVFGYIRASVLIFVATQSGGEVRGLSGPELATFAFLSQAFIMTVGAFGSHELPQRIRTGDIEVDLYRPVDLQMWELANWLGKAAFQVLARGLPPIALGAIAYDLVWPDSMVQWLTFAVAVVAASIVGFAVRFCSNLLAFWLIDNRGTEQMTTILVTFFAGLLLPINLFPSWLETVARALPFASMIQLPTEIFLGLHTGWGLAWILAQQALWALALLALGRAMLGSATRRLVVQGG